MISIGPCCSRMEYEKIEKLFGEDKVEVGCLGQCEPIENKCFGFIDEEFTVTDTEDEFVRLAKESIK